METASDAELIRRVLRKDEAAARALMQRYNRRLYRVARGVVRDDGEAEEGTNNRVGRRLSSPAEWVLPDKVAHTSQSFAFLSALHLCIECFNKNDALINV